MTIATILAGGIGLRASADIPKQFIEILEKPIIIYTLERLENHPLIDKIVIACVPQYIEFLNDLINKYGLEKVLKIVPGGSTYIESIKNCFISLKGICSDDDVLLMHMASSPLISDEIITDSIEICQKYGNASSAHPMYMCIAEKTGNNYSDKYLNRDILFGLNMPQSFKYAILCNLFKKVEADNLDITRTFTTDLLIDSDIKIYFSKWSPKNIKLTVKDDLDIIEALLIAENIKNKYKNKEN